MADLKYNNAEELQADIDKGVLSFVGPKINNRKTDIKKTELRVLDIGNSFSQCAYGSYTTNGDSSDKYLYKMIEASDVDVSNIAFYRLTISGGSFKDYVDCYNDSLDKKVSFIKEFGDLQIDESTGSSDDGSKMRAVLQNVRWDLVIIHQKSVYSNDYSIWETKEDGGYLTEFIRILKMCQPQAEIGTLLPHSEKGQDEGGSTLNRWKEICNATRHLCVSYGIDFVIPSGTAVQNIRLSQINTSSKDFSVGTHLARNIGQYTAACASFESIISQRYGVSIVGNTYRPTDTPDDEAIAVTNSNYMLCQMAAILACCDMWNVSNPDDIVIPQPEEYEDITNKLVKGYMKDNTINLSDTTDTSVPRFVTAIEDDGHFLANSQNIEWYLPSGYECKWVALKTSDTEFVGTNFEGKYKSKATGATAAEKNPVSTAYFTYDDWVGADEGYSALNISKDDYPIIFMYARKSGVSNLPVDVAITDGMKVRRRLE